MLEIFLGASTFTAIVVVLVLLVSAARAVLVPTGSVNLTVNARPPVPVEVGQKLHTALAAAGIHLPSACGGRGTCGQCRVTVRSDAGPTVAIEEALLSRSERANGVRLACQLTLRKDLAIELPAEMLGVRQWSGTVRSARNVTTLLRELVLDLPAGQRLDFRAGAFIQVICPPHHTRFADFDVNPVYRPEWDRLGLWRLEVTSDREAVRAYSLANPPAENDRVMLLVRIATPPPGAPASVPPGVVSSYLFQRKPGDSVRLSGPYGTFHVQPGDREMIFVGGGAGMAPMRSMIRDQLEREGTTRKMTFWYGARNRQELLYQEEFDRLAAKHPNFRWCAALSEPRAEDAWEGESGFVHEVLHARHLKDHPAPDGCDYYVCGPPMMMKALQSLLEQMRVDPAHIHFDDFGA